MLPTPTLDFSDSLYMRTQRGEVSAAAIVPEDSSGGLLSELSLRQSLLLALMAGIALMVVGILRLRGYRRALSIAKETSSDGEG